MELFHDVASTVVKLKMYPYFDIAHYILMCIAVRDDTPQVGSQAFSRKHPFASWLASMMMCFSGSILANMLIGEPVLNFLKHHDSLILSTIVWYLINYSPFNIIYHIASFKPIKFVIYIMKEVQRTKKVYEGVAVAYQIFPNAYLIVLAVGIVKGNGSAICSVFIRYIYGVFEPHKNEALYLSFVSKACLGISAAFLMEKIGMLHAPHEHIYLGAVIFLVYFRMSAFILGIVDPFRPFENLFCALFMGGLVDALKRSVDRRSDVPVATHTHGLARSTSSSSAASSMSSSNVETEHAIGENGRVAGGSTASSASTLKSRDEKKNE